MLEILRTYSKKIKYVEPCKVLKAIYGLIFQGKLIIDGLNSGKVIEKIANDICLEHNIKNISEIKMPLLIPMVDLQTGTVNVASSKQVRNVLSDNVTYFNDMPIGKAVRASCSYPVVISPCWYKGKQFVDGGIRENLPWKELKYIGADEVVGIDFETLLCDDDSFDNAVEVASRSLELICRELSIYEKNGIDYLITVPFPKVSLLDNSKIDVLYEAGYISAKKQLENFNFSK